MILTPGAGTQQAEKGGNSKRQAKLSQPLAMQFIQAVSYQIYTNSEVFYLDSM